MRDSLHVWTFGKHKFDRSFTEEKEENVKTLYRLIPLLVFAIGPFLTLEFYDQLVVEEHYNRLGTLTKRKSIYMKDIVSYNVQVLIFYFT